VLVVLAGCGGAADGGGADGADRTGMTPTTTLTPVPVPTETPVRTPTATATPMPTRSPSTPGGSLVVPGLTAGGVADPFRFAESHREALGDAPYRVRTNVTLVGADGTTLYAQRTRLHVGADGERYVYTSQTDTDETYPVTAFAPRLRLWYDGAVATFRIERPDGVVYERIPATGTGPVTDLSGHDRLVGLVSNTDLRLVGRGVDGDYRVAGEQFATLSVLRVPAFLAAPRNATLSMVVAADGLVRGYRLTYTTTYEGQRVRVVRERSYERAGPVAEPAWVREAVDATRASSTGAEARRVVDEG
jgi:hypothetical protein